MGETKYVRLDEASHARLLRLAALTGKTHPEIIEEALDLVDSAAVARASAP